MKNIVTASQVRKMKFDELKDFAIKLNISVEFGGSSKKKSHLLDEVLSLLRKQRNKNDRMIITETHRKIIDDESKTKSERMRLLYIENMPIKHIQIAMDSHYSFVHGVIQRWKDKQPDSITRDDALDKANSLSKTKDEILDKDPYPAKGLQEKETLIPS